MRGWKDIDWDQPRPSVEELVGSWTELDWESKAVESDPLNAYLTHVRDTHLNGGYLIGRWRATRYSDVTSWFAARNRLDEYEMHRLLFEHPVVRRDLAARSSASPTQTDAHRAPTRSAPAR